MPIGRGSPFARTTCPSSIGAAATFATTPRTTLLTANVTNPFAIANFASLQHDATRCSYQRLLGSTTFSSATIQRNRLLRAFPHMNGLFFNDQPLGIIKSHSLELVVNRRYSNGLTGNAALSREPGHREPDGGRVRPGAHALADQQQRPAVALHRPRRSTNCRSVRARRSWPTTGCSPTSLAAGRSAAPTNTSRARCSTGATTLLQRQPGRHQEGQPGDRASARRHVRPDQDVVQHRRRVREGDRRPAGRLPQARVPVPGRRGSRLRRLLPAREHRAHVQLGNRRTFNFRVDIQNLLNRQHYGNPNLDPTSTNFGQVRAVTQGVMRFITFNTTFRF